MNIRRSFKLRHLQANAHVSKVVVMKEKGQEKAGSVLVLSPCLAFGQAEL